MFVKSVRKVYRSKGVVFAALCLAFPSVVFPQNVDDPGYSKFIKDNLYMVGLYRGASGINTYLISEKKDPLFCVPPEIASDERKVINIIKGEISHPTYSKKYQYKDAGAPPDMVVAATLMKKFPCAAKEK